MSKSRIPPHSYSVEDWCKHRGVSRSMFYKLAEQGKAPKTYHVGVRRFVTDEADAEWLAAREAESDNAAA